jgi:capsular polysaccharide transport system permease protein
MKNSVIIQEIASFGADLSRYMRILHALFRQEGESRRTSPMESVLELVEPLFLIVTLVCFRFLFERTSSPSAMISPLGGSIFLFYASGLVPKYLFIYISFKRIGPAVGSHRRRFPVERRLDSLIVHIVLRLIDFSILGVFAFGVIYYFDTREAMPHKYAPILLAVAAIVSLGFGWGMLNVLLRQFVWGWHFVSIALNRGLIVMSGCLFLPDFLSPSVRYWISFNPEMHAIALFRTAFYPHYPMTVLDTGYMVHCAIFAVLFGLVLERIMLRINA